jgi:photosystem II stability/assembly factor-like uncharacterized protein
MKRDGLGRRWVTMAVSAGCLAACGPAEVHESDDPVAQGPDVLGDVRCDSWQPSSEDWSSLPAARPALMSALSASASGRYLYSVGTWWEAGQLERRAMRSPDFGDSWCVLSTPAQVSEIASAVDDERLLYALGVADGDQPTLLWRSLDGGDTWDEARGALPEGTTGGLTASASVVSLGDANPLSPSARLMSLDGGDSWIAATPPELVMDPAQAPERIEDFLITSVAGSLLNPNAAGQVLVWGPWDRPSEPRPSDYRFFTTDLLSGGDWRELEAPPLDTSRLSEPLQVVVDGAGSLYAAASGAVARSTDWGETWTEMPALPVASAMLGTLGQGTLVAVDYFQPAFWRSLDGGRSWRAVALPTALDPVLALPNGDLMGVTTDALAHSGDGGKSWQTSAPVPAPASLAVSAIAPERLWSIGSIEWNPGQVLGSDTLGDLQSLDGGLTWTRIGMAIPRQILFDGANPDGALAGFELGPPKRTEDAGQTWTEAALPTGFAITVASCSPPVSCQYAITQVVLSTSEPCYLNKTEDLGQSWSETLAPPELCYGTPTFSVAADDPETLFTACGAAICVSHDAGQSFEPHPVGDDPARYVGAILPLAGGVILAATWAITEPNATGHHVVVRSDDGGASWTEVLDAGAGTFVGSVAHPETAFLLEPVSNEPSRIHRTDDAGLSWRIVSPAATLPGRLPDFFAIADAGDGGFLAATTHGLAYFR